MIIKWKRLHSALDRRRKDLGISWRDVAKATQVSCSSFTRISNGLPLSAENMMRVLSILPEFENALIWDYICAGSHYLREHDPEIYRQHWQAADANRRAAGKFPQKEWLKMCILQENKCMKCGKKTKKPSPDHIIPISRGGTNVIENLQLLCWPCNQTKGTKTIDYRPKI